MLRFTFTDSILNIDAATWNNLQAEDYPFLRHEFLAALEVSGATTARRGWQPYHLLGYRQQQLAFAMPLYIKQHSYGEYVFDGSWADAWQRAGQDYFPKLVNAIPFTPCTGPRWLLHPTLDEHQLLPAAFAALDSCCQQLGLSGWHSLFLPEDRLPLAATAARRMGCQFHWHNPGYQNFEEFLAGLISRKRKAIVQERRKVAEQGIRFSWHEGDTLSESDGENFYEFYRRTYLKRSGHSGYLSADFFRRIVRHMPEHCLLVQARHQQDTIAAAWFFKDSHNLYGRYWGCLEEYDFLHFETCYYQGLDYLLKHGLQRFDGGAQGEHKIQRGFEPCATWSLHQLQDADFHRAVLQFVAEEQRHVTAYKQEAQRLSPWRGARPS